jgi:hypothetical protein
MQIARISPADRHPVGRQRAARRDPNKSRIANGSVTVSGADNRLGWPRRLRELLADHLSDLPDASVSERSIIRRACVIECELERMETAFALAGEASPDAIDLYARCAANLRRLLESVGLQRRAKPISGPSLGAILRSGIEQSEPVS